MRRFNKKVSVIFPAYNEAENIEVCVIVAHAILREMVDEFEVIVVDDGSSDGTGAVCSELLKRFNNLRVISNKSNQGYGSALKTGFMNSRYDLVFFSDSDRQFDIVNLKELLEYIDTYDIVVGFRRNRQDSAKRKFLSWGYNMLVGMLFGLDVIDIDCAFKLFRKDIFEKIEIESKQFFVNTEILAKAKAFGFTMKEVGVAHFPRVEGISKVGFVHIPKTLGEIARIYGSIMKLKKKLP